MKKSVGQRIEEFARMIRAIQDLSLVQLRRRRDDGLAEYEIVINAVIDALRIKHDNIWRDAAATLSGMRSSPVGQVTGSSIRNAIQCRTVLQNDVHQCVGKALQMEIDAVFKDAIASNRQASVATRLSRWPCPRIVDVGEDNRSAKINSRKLYLLAVDDIFAATGVKLEVKLDRGIDEITFEDLLHITGDVKTFALSVITYISMKSGSVRLIIEIKMEDAKELTRRFRAGRLQTLGGISIAALDESVNGFPAAGASDESFPVMLDLKQPLTDTDRQNLAEFFEREKERARQAESWLNLALSSILNWLGNYRWHHRLSIWGRITLAARLPRCADWMMTLHGLLFVVIFAIAFDRGATPLPHPCRAAIIWLEHRMDFLPSTWRSVGAAVALWGVVGLLIGCAFKLANRRKLPG